MKPNHRALAMRRKVREAVLRALYSYETGGEPSLPEGLPPAARERYLAELGSVHGDPEQWDERFGPHLAAGWSIERVGLIERLLLRMACWELWEAPDVPEKVTLSEHVALARKYVDGAGATFVHGVLGSVLASSPKAGGGEFSTSDEGWFDPSAPPDEPKGEGESGLGWTLKLE